MGTNGSRGNVASKLVISLDQDAAVDLALRAAAHGMSCAELAAVLLATIARDNLYNAVIDTDSNR
jgi:hypothetical protein